MACYDALAVASAVGRAVPRISVGTAVVTDKVEQVIASATDQLAFYENIPFHRRVLNWEGVHRAASGNGCRSRFETIIPESALIPVPWKILPLHNSGTSQIKVQRFPAFRVHG